MNGKKTRLFVDMDGTLAEWQEGTPLEEVCAPGYFAQLPPNENMAKAMIRFWEYSRKNNIEVFILSAVFDDGHSIRDKNAWLDQYIPFIDAEHRIFVSCEEPKTAYINEHLGGMSESERLKAQQARHRRLQKQQRQLHQRKKQKSRFLQKTPLIHRTRNHQQTKMPIPSFRAFKKEMLPEKMYQ